LGILFSIPLLGLEWSCRPFHILHLFLGINQLCHQANRVRNYCRENIHRLTPPCKHSVFSKATE
jgi:hypothetical protein